MEELLVTIARSLVDNPDDVQVETAMEEDTAVLSLTVHPDDKGRVIGRQGKIATAIRTLMKSAAVSRGQKVMVKII